MGPPCPERHEGRAGGVGFHCGRDCSVTRLWGDFLFAGRMKRQAEADRFIHSAEQLPTLERTMMSFTSLPAEAHEGSGRPPAGQQWRHHCRAIRCGRAAEPLYRPVRTPPRFSRCASSANPTSHKVRLFRPGNRRTCPPPGLLLRRRFPGRRPGGLDRFRPRLFFGTAHAHRPGVTARRRTCQWLPGPARSWAGPLPAPARRSPPGR